MSLMSGRNRALQLVRLGFGDPLVFCPHRIIIAGFTGRDRADVHRHIEELARAGVSAPDTVPAFYEVAAELLTTGVGISVSSAASSGEAEAVLLGAGGRWNVAIGSDHTARDLEREDIALSKRACPKVLGREVVAYEEVADEWDQLRLQSWTGQERALLQDGRLAQLTRPAELLDAVGLSLDEPSEGVAVFLGTVPLATEDFVVSDAYAMRLSTGDGRIALGLEYTVAPTEGRAL